MKRRMLMLAGLVMTLLIVAGYRRVWSVETYDDGTTTAWLGTRMETGIGFQVSVTVHTRPYKRVKIAIVG
jgi:hypothetical protein